MKYKKHIRKYFLPNVIALSALLLMSFAVAVPVSAATNPSDVKIPSFNNSPDQKKCAGVFLGIKIGGNNCVANGSTIETNPIIVYTKAILKVLTVGVGIAVVGGIVWGGIKYTSARGNASQVQDAINTIINSVIGLFLYLFMFAILNFLIPGGIFS